ncbi:MAG: hypothetical protein KGJ13_07870 [Patescibacteria group bacterium]|nr:hypothetical protein [Patescibacteria group bacterium]
MPHCVGYLECLWIAAYQKGSPVIGEELIVELACRYPGEPGKLCKFLHQSGFLDLIDGKYWVHDLWDHAPRYVRQRMTANGFGPQKSSLGAQKSPKVEFRSDLSAQKSPKVASCAPKGREEKEKDKEEEKENNNPPNPPSGGNDQKPKNPVPEPELQPSDQRLRAAWAEWLAYRKESGRKPLKPRSIKKQFAQFEEWGVEVSIAAIENSICKGYQGIFPPSTNQFQRAPPVHGHMDFTGIQEFLREKDAESA